MRRSLFIIILFFSQNVISASIETSTVFHSISDYDESTGNAWFENRFKYKDGSSLFFSFFSSINMVSQYRKNRSYLSVSDPGSNIQLHIGDFFLSHGCQTVVGNMDINSSNSVYNLEINSLKIIPNISGSEKSFHGIGIDISFLNFGILSVKNSFLYSQSRIYTESISENNINDSIDDLVFNTPDEKNIEHVSRNFFLNCTEFSFAGKFFVSCLFTKLWLSDCSERISWQNADSNLKKTDTVNSSSVFFKYDKDQFTFFHEISVSEKEINNLRKTHMIFCSGFKFQTHKLKTSILVKNKGRAYNSPFSQEPGGKTDTEYYHLNNNIQAWKHFELESEEKIERKTYSDDSTQTVISNSVKTSIVSEKFIISLKSSQQKQSGRNKITDLNYGSIKFLPSKKLHLSANTGSGRSSGIIDFYETSLYMYHLQNIKSNFAFYEKRYSDPYFRLSNKWSFNISSNINGNISISGYLKKKKISTVSTTFDFSSHF